MLGADDEDDARALAERVRGEAPAGSELTRGQRLALLEHAAGPGRPFAVFGGLGASRPPRLRRAAPTRIHFAPMMIGKI